MAPCSRFVLFGLSHTACRQLLYSHCDNIVDEVPFTGRISCLPTIDVVPINMVLRTKQRMESVSWSAPTLAKLGVYGNRLEWFRIAPIHEWNARAELDKSEESKASFHTMFIRD